MKIPKVGQVWRYAEPEGHKSLVVIAGVVADVVSYIYFLSGNSNNRIIDNFTKDFEFVLEELPKVGQLWKRLEASSVGAASVIIKITYLIAHDGPNGNFIRYEYPNRESGCTYVYSLSYLINNFELFEDASKSEQKVSPAVGQEWVDINDPLLRVTIVEVIECITQDIYQTKVTAYIDKLDQEINMPEAYFLKLFKPTKG